MQINPLNTKEPFLHQKGNEKVIALLICKYQKKPSGLFKTRWLESIDPKWPLKTAAAGNR